MIIKNLGSFESTLTRPSFHPYFFHANIYAKVNPREHLAFLPHARHLPKQPY